MPELVSESRAGLVYSSDAELVTAMDQLVDDPRRRRELGLRGYDAYRHKWTPDAHLKHYFALISQIAATRVGSRC
jgi:glycosyltransferase involved in cell wall biosynthesis